MYILLYIDLTKSIEDINKSLLDIPFLKKEYNTNIHNINQELYSLKKSVENLSIILYIIRL